MKRLLLLTCSLASIPVSAAASTATAPAVPSGKALAPAHLSVEQVVAKNIAARGGLSAWRSVETLTMSGKLEAGGVKNSELPFEMKMKRPLKSRLEIRFADKTAVQVFDGAHGWKLRPFLGRDEVEPYTAAEAKAAESWQELDGPLVDYAKKGTKVEMEGMEAIEGHNAYRLKLTLKGGKEQRLWIDAAKFLELKIDGEPRKMDGRLRNVAVYYRDYRPEGGLTVPHVLETVVDGIKGSIGHKMKIERITVNKPLQDALFAKPEPATVRVSVSSQQ